MRLAQLTKCIGIDDVILFDRVEIMTIDDSSEQFISLYQSVYKNLHSAWEDDVQRPSSEAIAVMNHLVISGPLTVTEAATHFNRAQSAMSELIDRLQANGYVDRVKDARDKRKTFVWLTKSGREIFNKTQEVLDRELLENSMELLTVSERTALIKSLESIASASQAILTKKRQEDETFKSL
ncbi:MarR family transcriptional regulator [Shewanella hanedai]|jgi:DNA-binding MarR family transcriptional regulator|uniref:MarR family transcriptional regulator n=2 Tax=Shewanella hanedai TaxID=25 RepID=A0A553JJW4_SHEHA|nr:MarR family transcriptional regulator [Shewanella hanedai]